MNNCPSNFFCVSSNYLLHLTYNIIIYKQIVVIVRRAALKESVECCIYQKRDRERKESVYQILLKRSHFKELKLYYPVVDKVHVEHEFRNDKYRMLGGCRGLVLYKFAQEFISLFRIYERPGQSVVPRFLSFAVLSTSG